MHEKTLLFGALGMTALFAVYGVVRGRSHAEPPQRGGEIHITPVTHQDGPTLSSSETPIRLTASDGTGLRLSAMRVDAVVEDPLALTEMHLTFENPEPRVLEGTFRITLPQGASLSRFAMKVGNAWQEGEVVEKQAARRAYEDFLHRRQDPALMEQGAGNEFSARVFPIPPRGVKEIKIAYTETIEVGAPFVVRLRGLPELGTLDIDVHAPRSGDAATGDPSASTFSLHQQRVAPGQDFVVSGKQMRRGGGLRSNELAIARIVPFATSRPEPVTSALVLVDTSASRALGLREQARLVKDVLARLGKNVPVTIACFDQEVAPLYEGAASEFGDEHVTRIVERGALGASDFERALGWAVDQAKRKKASRVVIVGDGVATAGETDAQKLRATVERLRESGVERLDAIALGGIRDDAFMRGVVRGVLDRDGVVLDGKLGADALAGRLGEATSSGIPVKVEGASWSWPQTLDGFQAGDEVLVHADIDPARPVRVTVGTQTFTPDLRTGPRPLVERAVAQARIQSLVDAPTADPTSTKREIVALSTRHRVLSPHTAMLVLEADWQYRQFGIDRTANVDILAVRNGKVEVEHASRSMTEATASLGKNRAKDAKVEQKPKGAAASATPAGDDIVTAEDGARVGTPGRGGEGVEGAARERTARGPTAPTIPSPPRDEEHNKSASSSANDGYSGYGGVGAAASAAAPASRPNELDQTRRADIGGSPAREPADPSAADRRTLPLAAPTAALPPTPTPRPAPTAAAPSIQEPAKSSVATPRTPALTPSPYQESPTRRYASPPPPRSVEEQHAAGRRATSSGSANAPTAIAQVRPGALVVEGGVSQPAVQRVVRSAVPQLRACYTRALSRDHALRGHMDVRVALSASGDVVDAHASGNVARPELASCVAGVFQRLHFPAPGTQDARFTASFELVPVTSDGGDAIANSTQGGKSTAPYEGRFKTVMDDLARGEKTAALAEAVQWHEDEPGDILALVALGEAYESLGDLKTAARAYGSILELYSFRADSRRFAGERLERLADAEALRLAIDTYAKAVEQRPDHPASHRLYAFALLKAGRHENAFEALKKGANRAYPDGRFRGVAQILREDLGLVAASWSAAEPARRGEIARRLREAGGSEETAPSLRFVLVWETDANDVDFHIYDGRGGHAFYSDPSLPSGGSLYADVTTGYGPECFTIRGPSAQRAYPYKLQAHYFSRGPMGYGMGKLQIVEHDGKGLLSFEERPFTVMADRAFVDLGTVEKSSRSATASLR